jgi:hypothetical protein
VRSKEVFSSWPGVEGRGAAPPNLEKRKFLLCDVSRYFYRMKPIEMGITKGLAPLSGFGAESQRKRGAGGFFIPQRKQLIVVGPLKADLMDSESRDQPSRQ